MDNRFDTSLNNKEVNQLEKLQHKFLLSDLSAKLEAQHNFHKICSDLGFFRTNNDEKPEDEIYDFLLSSGNFNAEMFSHPEIFLNNSKHIDQLFELIIHPDNFICFVSDHCQRKSMAYFKPQQTRLILDKVLMPDNFECLINNFVDLIFWHEHYAKYEDLMDKFLDQIINSPKVISIIHSEENLITLAQDKNITADQKDKLFSLFKQNSNILLNEKSLHNLCSAFKEYIDQILDELFKPEKMHIVSNLFTQIYSFSHLFNKMQMDRIYDFVLKPENFNKIVSSTTINLISLSCRDENHKKQLFILLISNFNHLISSKKLLQDLGEIFTGYDFIFKQPTVNQAKFEVKKFLPEEQKYANTATNQFFSNFRLPIELSSNIASFWGTSKRTVAARLALISKSISDQSSAAREETFKENLVFRRA